MELKVQVSTISVEDELGEEQMILIVVGMLVLIPLEVSDLVARNVAIVDGMSVM